MSRLSGFVASHIATTKLVSWGKIDLLVNDFKLKNNSPFTILVIPKEGTGPEYILINAEPYQSNGFVPTPVKIGEWQSLLFNYIEASSIDLETYDVWWGCTCQADTLDRALSLPELPIGYNLRNKTIRFYHKDLPIMKNLKGELRIVRTPEAARAPILFAFNGTSIYYSSPIAAESSVTIYDSALWNVKEIICGDYDLVVEKNDLSVSYGNSWGFQYTTVV